MKRQKSLLRVFGTMTIPAFSAVVGAIVTFVVYASAVLFEAVYLGLTLGPEHFAPAAPWPIVVITLFGCMIAGAAAAYVMATQFRRVLDDFTLYLSDAREPSRKTLARVGFIELRRLRAGVTRTINALRRENEVLRRAAFVDLRTGLASVVALEQAIEAGLSSAQFESPAAYFLLELDNVGQVTEQYGGSVGETLIVRAAGRLQEALSGIKEAEGAALRGATLASLGSGRFALFLPAAINRDCVTSIVREVRQAFAAPFDVAGYALIAHLSGGIVMAPEDAETLMKLRRHAQLALDQVRRDAGTGFRFYSPRLNRVVRGKLLLEAELREGVAKREFKAVFQPKVDFRTGEITGAEALVRWRRENGKIISPATFIPLAEETGLINQIGEQVLEAACLGAKAWLFEGFKLAVAVNVSPRQFVRGSEFTDSVLSILKRTGLPPHRLELEITESMAVADPSKVADVMRPLRAMGMKLAIDDFGTGHSNLSMLTQLPFDVFKIDRQFVSALDADRHAPAIVEMILAMAETLGLETVAEGVETPQQAEFLRRRGCTTAQGFLYSQPLTHSALMEFLRRWRPEAAFEFTRRAS